MRATITIEARHEFHDAVIDAARTIAEAIAYDGNGPNDEPWSVTVQSSEDPDETEWSGGS